MIINDILIHSCGHYFCEKCALEQYRKTPKCYVCGLNTNGCFNKATEIIERLEKKHQQQEEKNQMDDDDDEIEDNNTSESENGGDDSDLS